MVAIMTKDRQVHIFNEEIMPHVEALYSYACRFTQIEADAEDLVQDTCLKAFSAIESYVPGTNAKAWLFRILHNTFINQYRRKARGPISMDINEFVPTVDDEEHGRYSGYTDLREEVFKDLMGDEVTEAINALPAPFRAVILLCDFEDFSYEEIAKILDIPVGTVRSRLHRGRNILKEKLNDYAAGLGWRAP